MADTSRPQVTITLGRTGQVVKRAGAVFDSERSDPVPVVGSKRSVRDRLGSSVDVVQLDNKRFRGDNGRWNLKASSSMDDFHLSKDDLRYKIMKRTEKDGHGKSVDLRDMLSRRARPSMTNHEPKLGRQREADERVQMRDERQRVTQPTRDEIRREKPNDDRQHIPISEASMTRHFRNQPQSQSQSQTQMRNSYSPWTLDHIRRKSPDTLLHRPRPEEPLARPVIRPYGSLPYPTPGPTPTPSFLTKPVKPLPLVPPSLPPTQRTQFPVEAHVTVEGFLRTLGLEKYLISFKVEEVDMAALSQMGDHDLKELGIPMGPRKKILLALLARTRRQAR